MIGHRGNRAHAPENTIPSLLEAVALGVDAVEFDLHVTRDGVLVLMHDTTLDRTTDASGPVAARTLAELRAVDAGARFTRDGSSFPWRGRGAGIPTFDEVVDALPRTLPLIIEIKTPDATPLLREAIARHGLAPRIIVAGFDAACTRPLHGAGFAMGACTPDMVSILLPSLLRRPLAAPAFQAMCIPPIYHGIPVPIASLARSMKPHGVVTHIWTVNDPAYALKLWRHGVNGIISDDPGAILAVRGLRSAR
ncbi:glycerophosphoryl diester phosphodiesterase family protein [Gemmatimonas aurantiaca T-27]|uniref:Glycerophosphoryl diester phosphodiesterase family protein n=1 Tax=Gemmatimonas aurantiaca (strain DSM 14586 / JCM 11422 / NBRC 100505 / T-27) TaxID=379066 RepID=C1A4D6_GEMAT|nr:glycerophosphoryl diester phosphodiesterase family protein [Gemmatimonas aurantiaca T-27]